MSTDINLLEKYNERMAAGMADKLFFIDEVNADVYLDFGCADGTLLRKLRELKPGKKFYGYDENAAMLGVASSYEQSHSKDRIEYRAILQQINSLLDCEKGTKALILSSVIHEIYSYSDPTKFWDWVWARKFDYICIRDMSISRGSEKRLTDFDDVVKIVEKSSHDHLHQFQMKYGTLDWEKNMVHWLLKYHYIDGWDEENKYQRHDNWERELNENYLGLYYEDLLELIPQQYAIIHKEHFTLPYIRDKVKKDLDIDLQTKTHVKLILRRQ